MGNRIEAYRRQVISEGGHPRWHSLNQKILTYALDRSERGLSRKVENARRKRAEKEQFVKDLSKMPFYWKLRDILDSRGAVDRRDIEYIFEEGGRIEQVVDQYTTEKGIEVTVANLYVPARRNVQAEDKK